MFGGQVSADEFIGSNDWVMRANNADMKYPILVVRGSQGIWVGDGNHRLWHAYKRGQRYIKAYVVNEDDLDKYVHET